MGPGGKHEQHEDLLTVEGLGKSFDGYPALRGVRLGLRPGETRALLGPNGAGKSTIIKILDGVYSQDAGRIEVRSASGGPGRLGVIHQDFGLIDILSVRENLQIPRSVTRPGSRTIDHRRERADAREWLAQVNLNVDPETTVGDLGLGQKALIAIARVLSREADVLVLDEVTAALTASESAWLFEHLRGFTAAGGGVIVVSHRLKEIVEHCDTVTLLRDGAVAYDGVVPTLDDLHAMFTAGARAGEQPGERKDRAAFGKVLLQARGASSAAVDPIDIEVHAGEVVGLVGPLSSSLYDVAHLLAGRATLDAGNVGVTSGAGDGSGVVGFLAEDRNRFGNLLGMSVGDNLTVSSLGDHRGPMRWLRKRSERDAVLDAITEMDVQPARSELPIDSLSGGNQQKVLIGRAKLLTPDVYVLCEPTRGVDVSVRQAIYDFIRAAVAEGAAVIIAAIDVDDVLAVADRVAVVDGRHVGAFADAAGITPAELLTQVG